MFTTILFYSGLAGLATVGGAALILFREKWAKENSIYLISFAAGILLGASFLHLIPESLELTPYAFPILLAGFLVFYLLESTIMIHSCIEEECPEHSFGIVSVLGIGLHSLLDGVAIGVGFEISREIGFIATLGVLVHEFPEGLSTLAILYHAKIEKKKALLYTLLVALATPMGAVLVYLFLKDISVSFLGILLAFSAGSFIYVSASDLLPQTHKKISVYNVLVFLVGVLFVGMITLLF